MTSVSLENHRSWTPDTPEPNRSRIELSSLTGRTLLEFMWVSGLSVDSGGWGLSVGLQSLGVRLAARTRFDHLTSPARRSFSTLEWKVFFHLAPLHGFFGKPMERVRAETLQTDRQPPDVPYDKNLLGRRETRTSDLGSRLGDIERGSKVFSSHVLLFSTGRCHPISLGGKSIDLGSVGPTLEPGVRRSGVTRSRLGQGAVYSTPSVGKGVHSVHLQLHPDPYPGRP